MVECFRHKTKGIFLANYNLEVTVQDIKAVYYLLYKHRLDNEDVITIGNIGKQTSLWDMDALKLAAKKAEEAKGFIKKTYVTELFGIHNMFYRMYIGFLSKKEKEINIYIDKMSDVEKILNFKFPDDFKRIS